MTALDIFVLLLLGGGALVGFLRGFVHETLSLAAWIAAIVVLKAFHTPVAAALTHSVGTATGAAALAFALLFLPTFFIVKWAAKQAGGRTKRSILGPIDRILGGGFGMLKGLIGATLFFLLANLATDLVYGPQASRPEWLTHSRTYPLLNASGRAIVDWVETRRHPRARL
ncbi:MAG: CvpA family protein [Sphingomicrobium sp.]|nr:CvpA family protein [Sphingomonadales bacterium]